ncbi:FMN-binding negative transcriptional regulator [Tunturiibacter empetritectus]|uniref:Transcriptional regulator n=1 Tax=Tunturiibacter lichenicola TaxID=2051959 RepID=A0A852VGF7_9BACT|nr:FMN-binding negative transcriptional regulator [Edaphobacter lichenicola]NYF89514.1 transcriptional regulator [Edaphobacter lichenicola]
MYIPRANEEQRVPVLHSLMRAEPLAALVTLSSSGLVASHIPMVLEEGGSPLGVLRGHVSRANSQWRDLEASVEALAIFSGPQHYISPTWYPGKVEHGREVPTWNYVVVHAYGSLKVMDDKSWMRAHLERLTNENEAETAMPWKVSDAPEEFIETMMKGIVGLELPIGRLEGKWKVSQNRTVRDREGVLEGLSKESTPGSLMMKRLVEDAM